MAIQPVIALFALSVVYLIGYAAYDEHKSRPSKEETEHEKKLCLCLILVYLYYTLKPTKCQPLITKIIKNL
jgi:hypothetical protein